MHDATRRRIVRGALLALCLAPTCLAAGWAVARRLPGHTAAYEAALSQTLGLPVSIHAVRHPRPGTLLATNVELTDPETGELIVHCRGIEATEDDAGGWTLVVAQPTFRAERGEWLWALLERRLRRAWTADGPLRIVAREATWEAGPTTQTFIDVEARLTSDATQELFELAFRLPLAEGLAEPALIRVVRARDQQPPRTRFELDTGPTPLPCGLLAPLIRAHETLGPAARFRGTLAVTPAADGWAAELAGQFSDVDLETLVARRFPHLVSGLAEIRVDRARVERGRLVEAAGSVVAGPGQVGRSLIAAGSEYLRLGRGTAGLPTTSVVPFERLACDVLIDHRGLMLHGRCPNTTGGVLVDLTQVWWSEPAEQPLPLASLVRTLVPASLVQVPAVAETLPLVELLPVASTATLPGAGEPELPRAHLRVGSPLDTTPQR